MSNLVEAKKLLQRYTLARIPFISINTIERARTLDILKEVANDNGLPFFVHTLSKGIYDLSSNRTASEDKSIFGAMEFASDEMKKRELLTIIFTEVPDLTADGQTARQMLDLVTLANEHGGTIIVLTNNTIWANLQRLGMTLKVDLPDEVEMYGIIKEYIDDYRSQINIEWDDNDIKEVASTLTGVTKIEAENVIAALIANKEILKRDKEDIVFAKDRLFSDIS